MPFAKSELSASVSTILVTQNPQAARRCNDENESKESAKRLAEIKHNQAKTLAKEGHLSDALAKQRAFLEFAMLSGDESMQWKARHALGLTLMKHGMALEAAELHNQCLQIAKSEEDNTAMALYSS
ncbi:hypothetical protein cyc_04717 [Cyclospora cayetanensis]|uniref:Tetratricopeptide repeat-containing protein n=1 Tax=Cyclospora cayetanensis TaxID=88456 RepID=A0A1D3D532_9EIME|nr:hypothetical protein cyc_04717 [Cyclospora cayetanensis]